MTNLRFPCEVAIVRLCDEGSTPTQNDLFYGKYVLNWFTYIPSKYLYETYDLETADKLHTLELDFLINGGKLSADLLNWARENIPKIIRPDAYFNPLVVYLKDKNIEFKVK